MKARWGRERKISSILPSPNSLILPTPVSMEGAEVKAH